MAYSKMPKFTRLLLNSNKVMARCVLPEYTMARHKASTYECGKCQTIMVSRDGVALIIHACNCGFRYLSSYRSKAKELLTLLNVSFDEDGSGRIYKTGLKSKNAQSPQRKEKVGSPSEKICAKTKITTTTTTTTTKMEQEHVP